MLIAVWWLQKLGTDYQSVKEQDTHFMWRDSISRSFMMWKFETHINLKSQTGLKL
jgi:hypothetical protein